MDALEEIFRRTGATGPDDYLPIHTRAHSAELKTIIRHATDPAVARVELVPSSSGARTPDLILDVLEADGTTRRTRVEIRTLIGTTAGPKSRGAAGARPGTVDDIVSAVSSKAKDSPGARRSQLAVPMLDVPTGGTLAIHLPFAGPDAVLDVAAAMKKLERTLADAKHVEAIEFYLPGGFACATRATPTDLSRRSRSLRLRRQSAQKTATTRGSNCVPAQRRSSARASASESTTP
jgi:hypothetical protein